MTINPSFTKTQECVSKTISNNFFSFFFNPNFQRRLKGNLNMITNLRENVLVIVLLYVSKNILFFIEMLMMVQVVDYKHLSSREIF